jgi:hypothetical protein
LQTFPLGSWSQPPTQLGVTGYHCIQLLVEMSPQLFAHDPLYCRLPSSWDYSPAPQCLVWYFIKKLISYF